MFFRKVVTKINGKKYTYVKLIETYRHDNKIKQRVIANFGSIDNLSANSIHSLFFSLSKVYYETRNQNEEALVSKDLNLLSKIKDILVYSQIKQIIKKHLGQDCDDLIDALIIKSMLTTKSDRPINDVCKSMHLINADGYMFYNAIKYLGKTELKESLIRTRLTHDSGNHASRIPLFIVLFPSSFEGPYIDIELPTSIYMHLTHRKEFILLVAFDIYGNPIDFEIAFETNTLATQLNELTDRIHSIKHNPIIVLNEGNYPIPESLKYLLARVTNNIPEANMPNNDNGTGSVYFDSVKTRKINDLKLTEMRVNLAKVTAGLETIKADILLGKIKKKSVVHQKAKGIIKNNDCQDLVSYDYNPANQSFTYELKTENINEVTNKTWLVENFSPKVMLPLNKLKINTEDFEFITDQLTMPPTKMYVDLHYTPEIIAGHIQLEIIKYQINMIHSATEGGGNSCEQA